MAEFILDIEIEHAKNISGAFDVYIKKMLIEKLIDDLAPQTPDSKHKGDKNQK